MKTLAVDKYQRVRLPDARGGQRFAYENKGNGVLILTELVPKEGRVVKPVKGPNGLYRLPSGVKLSREEITAAIRADRDSR